MRVSFDWSDAAGEAYTIEAEVHPIDHNRISIISILTSDGVDVDFRDCEKEEQQDILWLAKKAAEELDSIPDDDDDDDDDDDNYDRSEDELDLY